MFLKFKGHIVRRLTIFLKGNADVRDTLHSCRHGNEIVWNGLNHLMRQRHPELSIRVRHETFPRSDVTLAATDTVPTELAVRNPPLGAMTATMQFSRAVFTTPVDAVVISLQPDISNIVVRHKAEGWLLLPNGSETWPARERQWLVEAFERLPYIDVETSINNIERIANYCRAERDIPVLIYNLCSAIPGTHLHCHAGCEDILPTRIRRFNLALVELSQRTGVSVIDVDAILSRHGAERLLLDAFHFTPEACQLVADEVANVLDEVLDL